MKFTKCCICLVEMKKALNEQWKLCDGPPCHAIHSKALINQLFISLSLLQQSLIFKLSTNKIARVRGCLGLRLHTVYQQLQNYCNLIILNDREFGAHSRKIMVGETKVSQECNAKLQRITVNDTQTWNTQIYGKGGTIPSLNTRMFIFKRLKNQIGGVYMKKTMDSLYTSKLRYGLPLFGRIKQFFTFSHLKKCVFA